MCLKCGLEFFASIRNTRIKKRKKNKQKNPKNKKRQIKKETLKFSQFFIRLFSAVYYIMKTYSQTSLQRTPTVSKKVSSITRCTLYRVLNFFKEKIIVDKNLTMFYVICDSLQLQFLKAIWIVHFGTLCNLSVFIYPKFI